MIFINPLHGTFVVAAFEGAGDYIPGTKGWGWDIAFKGTYVGWAVTAVIKCALALLLPATLGHDPRYYFLEHLSMNAFYVFEIVAVVAWMNYLLGDGESAGDGASLKKSFRDSLRRDSMIAGAVLSADDGTGGSAVAPVGDAKANKGKHDAQEESGVSKVFRAALTVFYVLMALTCKSQNERTPRFSQPNARTDPAPSRQRQCRPSSSASTGRTLSTTYSALYLSA